MCRLRDSRIPLLRKLQNLGDDVRQASACRSKDKLKFVGHAVAYTRRTPPVQNLWSWRKQKGTAITHYAFLGRRILSWYGAQIRGKEESEIFDARYEIDVATPDKEEIGALQIRCRRALHGEWILPEDDAEKTEIGKSPADEIVCYRSHGSAAEATVLQVIFD